MNVLQCEGPREVSKGRSLDNQLSLTRRINELRKKAEICSGEESGGRDLPSVKLYLPRYVSKT